MQAKAKLRVLRTGQYCILAIVLVILLFPIYWMINTSLKFGGEVAMFPQSYWPRNLTFENYEILWMEHKFGQSALNTLIIALSSALGGTILGAMAGFGFSRFDLPAKPILLGFLLVTMAVPGMVMAAPLFISYRSLGLLDTKLGLILVNLSGTVTFSTFYLFAFFHTIPTDLDDAAMIDGCSTLGTLFRIILPLVKPGISVTFIVLFIGAWNEFLFAFFLTFSDNAKVLTVRLLEVPADQFTPLHRMAAGGLINLVPIVIIIMIAQRYIVEGLVTGALGGK